MERRVAEGGRAKGEPAEPRASVCRPPRLARPQPRRVVDVAPERPARQRAPAAPAEELAVFRRRLAPGRPEVPRDGRQQPREPRALPGQEEPGLRVVRAGCLRHRRQPRVAKGPARDRVPRPPEPPRASLAVPTPAAPAVPASSPTPPGLWICRPLACLWSLSCFCGCGPCACPAPAPARAPPQAWRLARRLF